MRKGQAEKLSHAAHIKKNTRGTSNELSFSVLDAAKNALDEGKDRPTDQARRFGRISLFTLPIGRKKPPSTPRKDESLALTAGAEVPRAQPSDTPGTIIPIQKHEVAPQKYDKRGKYVARLNEKTVSGHGKRASVHMVEHGAGGVSDAFPSGKTSSPFETAHRKSGRTSQEEIAWRKTRRRRSRIVAGVVATLAIVAVVGAGVLYLYHDNQRYQQNTLELDQALSAMQGTDQLLLDLDGALQDPLSEEASKLRDERAEDRDSALSTLQEVEQQASDAAAGLREAREHAAASELVSAAQSRSTMFQEGWRILDAADGVADRHARMNDAWQGVLQADETARQAARLAAQGDQNALQQSSDLSRQAITQFQNARTAIDQVAQEDKPIDVDSYLVYIDKRVESLGYAIASNDALLARDTASATQQNDAYNEADRQAAEMASSLPPDPGQPILDEFELQTENAVEAYEAARSQASSSDAFLRDYLGRSSK